MKMWMLVTEVTEKNGWLMFRVYLYTHTHRHTDGQTDRRIDRRDRQIELFVGSLTSKQHTSVS